MIRRTVRSKIAAMVTLLAAVFAACAQASPAYLHVESNGGGWATIADNGQMFDGSGTDCANVLSGNCRDKNAAGGVVEFGTSWLDAFFMTTTIGKSNLDGDLLNLSTVSLTAGAGGGFLRIWWSDTGFTSPAGPVTVQIHISGTIPAYGQLEIQAYEDNSNSLNGTANPILAMPQWFTGPSAGASPFSFDGLSVYNPSGPYSLTQYAYLFLPEYSTATFDWYLRDPASAQESTVPEPGSAALLGSGLVGLALLVGWRHQRAWVPTAKSAILHAGMRVPLAFFS